MAFEADFAVVRHLQPEAAIKSVYESRGSPGVDVPLLAWVVSSYEVFVVRPTSPQSSTDNRGE